jgi:hypothetical protein
LLQQANPTILVATFSCLVVVNFSFELCGDCRILATDLIQMLGHDQKRMTGILPTTYSRLAASQMARQRLTKRKSLARAIEIKRFCLITG